MRGGLCRREFDPGVYRPGVISLARVAWGSLGGGLLLALVAVMSQATGIAVLYPPLAATCFINTTCVYLRVARPKPVIVGHFVSSLCGLAGVETGRFLAGGTALAVPLALGSAVLYAAVSMQLCDADHPPAAATAAIPAILPLPMPEALFPFYMAWGATITVVFAIAWNRVWFEFPTRDDEHCVRNAGLYLPRPQVAGLALCVAGLVLMSCKPFSPAVYGAGLWGMGLGGLVLGTHHFWGTARQRLRRVSAGSAS